MKIQIVGGGGRAHTTAWALGRRCSDLTGMACLPGNAGIGMEKLQNEELVTCVPLAATDINGQLAFAKAYKPDLTICSEDDPLALGIVDLFQANGLRIWGPTRKAAKFEWSKIWAWKFMTKYGIPTPEAQDCYSGNEALVAAKRFDWKCAVKVDGLAFGKGVLVCHTESEVIHAVYRIFEKNEFGEAGKAVLVQKLVEGKEVSFHFLCSGKTAVVFQSSKDHKKGLDGNLGDNTGGMGTISPSPDVEPEAYASFGDKIMRKWLKGCEEEGIDFRGILYPGVMLTNEGPMVLEFNARLGDPEAQVYLTRLKTSLLTLIEGSLNGEEFRPRDLIWSPDLSVCVMMSAPGYPGKYDKGKIITGLEEVAKLPNRKVFHSGTTLQNGQVVTNGGRVLGVTAWANTLERARALAYEAVHELKFEGGQYFRRDIGGLPLWE